MDILGDVMAGFYALLLLLAGKSLIPQKSIDKTCIVKENIVILQQQIPPRFPFEQRTRAELRFYRDMDYTKNALDYTQIATQLKKHEGKGFHKRR